MAAYIVTNNVVADPGKMLKYVPKAVDSLHAHGAEVLVIAEKGGIYF